jgi:hypothetical protein
MTDNGPISPPQYAFWFFLAATFVFLSPTIFFRGSAAWWVTIVPLAVGMLLLVLGGIQLGREVRARRAVPPTEH